MFTYTKLLRISLESLEERAAYDNMTHPYIDWFISQKEQGLVDTGVGYVPFRYVKNQDGVECIFEILLLDQAQVYSFQAVVFPLGKIAGYPIRHNEIVDVNITADQIPPDFILN